MRIQEFIQSIRERDEAKPTLLEVVLAYPGFHIMVLFHPVAHFLWKYDVRGLARLWAYAGRLLTGIEIHPGAVIGKNLFIDHGTGVVIGQTAIIGDNCRLYQGVTLGGKGTVIEGRRHPHVGDRVTIGAGTLILGALMIGNDAKVGAHSLVTADVPAGMTAVGSPARLFDVRATKQGSYGLPDGEVPDPIDEKIKALEVQLNAIKSSLK